jgi:hypothetical protein
MTGDRMLDRVMAHLRTHVAELRRLEQEGARPEELAERRQLIAQLQNRLADVVREVVSPRQRSTA